MNVLALGLTPVGERTYQGILCDIQRFKGVEETDPIRKMPQRVPPYVQLPNSSSQSNCFRKVGETVLLAAGGAESQYARNAEIIPDLSTTFL